MRRPPLAPFLLGLSALVWVSLRGRPALGFPHVVQQGETLASVAERVYGLVEFERVLVAANGLDAGAGSQVVRGQRLEVPALDHYRVQAGDTWATLAQALLGDAERQDVLSAANDGSPWLPPAEGAEIVVPYNLRVSMGPGDTLITVALRFLGSREKAWILARYNRLKDAQPRRGEVVLVPLSSLKLTDQGKAEALAAVALERSQGAGSAREAQRKAEAELPAMLGEVRTGRYIDAVHHGARLLTLGELSKPELAMIHRQLLEAYAALDARGHASAACRAWRENDPDAPVDPTYLSPKIMAACEAAFAPPPDALARKAPALSPRSARP